MDLAGKKKLMFMTGVLALGAILILIFGELPKQERLLFGAIAVVALLAFGAVTISKKITDREE